MTEIVIQYRSRERGGAWKDVSRAARVESEAEAQGKLRELRAKNPELKYRAVKREIAETVMEESEPEFRHDGDRLAYILSLLLSKHKGTPFGSAKFLTAAAVVEGYPNRLHVAIEKTALNGEALPPSKPSARSSEWIVIVKRADRE